MYILPYSVKSKCLSLGKQTALMLSPPLDLKEENNILSFQQFPSAFHSIRRQCCSIVESKSETLFMSLGGTKCCCPNVMSNQPCSSRCCCFGIIAFPAVGVLLAFCWRSVGVLLAFCWRSAGVLLAFGQSRTCKIPTVESWKLY